MSSVTITAPSTVDQSHAIAVATTGSLAELAKNLCPHLGVKGSIQHDKLRVSMLQNQRDQLLDYMRNKDEFFRSDYYGGHVDMYKPYGKNLYYYDVNSLYPFVMKTYPMPCGTPVWNGNIQGIDLSEIFGIVQAYIITPKNIDKPFLSIRNKNVLNTILRRMAHYNPFHNLQSPGDDSNTTDTGNNSSSNASSKMKRGLTRGSKSLPNGKKKKIDVNSWGQPNQENLEMNTYTSDIGFQVRMRLPIIYESFKHVHNDRIALVVKGPEECYDISHVAWFNLKEKIKDAWRRYKYRLNTTLIVGNNPEDVKASPAPKFVPWEDWVKFIDYCNSEKFLVKSKMNKENRAKLIASCTLGRTSMPITRHKLAKERGVTDEEIGRVKVYIPTHTKKDKTIQCPDVIKFGKERKGGTRGMGVGMSISLVEKVGHIVNKNEELRSNNNELKFTTEKLRKDLDVLTKYVGNIPVRHLTGFYVANAVYSLCYCYMLINTVSVRSSIFLQSIDISVPLQDSAPFLVISPTDNFPSQQETSSSQREQEKHQHIDKECMLVGFPWRIVAHGAIVVVDSTDMCYSVALGDDFYKVAIHDIVDDNALLFRPNSNIKRLLNVGIESFVAWPKSMITF
ncbi:hypothetical protein GIB67_022856 [Kingdonia uniflora]|uniref:DNA-directed DNA polymerase n=1 Tax=Kingdonia uniflora TaxID=39325 RepID=A0A7J7P6V6_9MAGN|nr:hypothetical protein GIB67_022856 [Kingdonia uniflora]